MADVKISGNLNVTGDGAFGTIQLPSACVGNNEIKSAAAIARSKLALDQGKRYFVPWTSFRVFDEFHTNLPSQPATDDLGLVAGTHGAGAPSLRTEDLKNESGNPTLNKARFTFALPPEYEDGETITAILNAGMITTVASDTATVHLNVYVSNKEGVAGGSPTDLCATAAQSINSLTFAEKSFTITPTGLEAGDLLDVLITTSVSDSATGTAVIACIGAVWIALDIRG